MILIMDCRVGITSKNPQIILRARIRILNQKILMHYSSNNCWLKIEIINSIFITESYNIIRANNYFP